MQREEAVAAAAWPGDPAREPPPGTMLACLTRGNLLDVLQEGFNEVTVCSSHSQLPSPSASRLISRRGSPSPLRPQGDPRSVPLQSPKELK